MIDERPLRRRRRKTETLREASRLSDAIVKALGRDLRETRRRLRLTQAALAAKVDVHQTWISDIELGRGHGVPVESWVALGLAIDRPLAVKFSRALDQVRFVPDTGHLDMQEAILGLAASLGRPGSIERPSNPVDPRHATDVAILDEPRSTLILVEAWNTFGDVGAAIRSTQRKEAEARTRSTRDRVASVWVVRATAANRAVVARYPNTLASVFEGSSRRWVRTLVDGDSPPAEPGLVWFDPASRRVTEWRRG